VNPAPCQRTGLARPDRTRRSLTSFYARCRARGLSATTVQLYASRLECFHQFVAGRLPGTGAPDLHAHRPRHTAATFFLRGGGDILALQRILGHSSPTMVRRYAEVTQSDPVERYRRASPGEQFRSAPAKRANG